jgi:hypothetical protein
VLFSCFKPLFRENFSETAFKNAISRVYKILGIRLTASISALGLFLVFQDVKVSLANSTIDLGSKKDMVALETLPATIYRQAVGNAIGYRSTASAFGTIHKTTS